jgi:Uma2 family endonuclease
MHLVRRNATWDDLCALPEQYAGELLGGDLYASDNPSPIAHARIAVAAALLEAGRRSDGRWWILMRPEHHLSDDVLVSDLGGWRRDRTPRLPEAWSAAPPPDWVCEILEPTSVVIDRSRKLPLYARAGVGHIWLVDPLTRTLEVYRLLEEHWLLVATHGGDEPVRAEPFQELEIDITEWWLDPEAPPAP